MPEPHLAVMTESLFGLFLFSREEGSYVGIAVRTVCTPPFYRYAFRGGGACGVGGGRFCHGDLRVGCGCVLGNGEGVWG